MQPTEDSVNSNNLMIEDINKGDLKIIEEDSDSDDVYIDEKSRNTIATFSNAIEHSSKARVLGPVSIANSENVQLGNNTFFNGPVIIKQIIRSGVDNTSYVNSGDENAANVNNSAKNTDTTLRKNTQIRPYYVLTLLTVVIIVIGVCCAIFFSVRSNNTNENENEYSSTTSNSVFSPAANDSLIISPHHLRIVSRDDWIAQPPVEQLDKLSHPVPWVIITHTATEGCSKQSDCVLRVRLMQTYHIESKGWSDIAYNFLVGGDGSVYYGRGWDYVGAHTKGYNKFSIGIAFIGTFNTIVPPQQQVDACKKLLKIGVDMGVLAKDYKLFAHRQLMSTLSPGDKVVEFIKEWPHFVTQNSITELLPH